MQVNQKFILKHILVTEYALSIVFDSNFGYTEGGDYCEVMPMSVTRDYVGNATFKALLLEPTAIRWDKVCHFVTVGGGPSFAEWLKRAIQQDIAMSAMFEDEHGQEIGDEDE